MKTTLRTIAISAALIASGAGLLQAAQAQTAATGTTATTGTTTQVQQDGHRGGHHGDRHHGMHGMRGMMGASPLFMLGQLKGKLNLTESQQKLWTDAQTKGNDLRTAMRTQHEADSKALQDQIASAPLDMHALVSREEAGRTALKPKFDAVRDAWVAVYDSLDAKQKQIVTDAVKQRQARGERMRERMSQRHGQTTPAQTPNQAVPAQAPAAK
jgi:hypothetical protein